MRRYERVVRVSLAAISVVALIFGLIALSALAIDRGQHGDVDIARLVAG